MRNYTSRIWSLVTLLVLVAFVVSFGYSRPTAAKSIADEGVARKTAEKAVVHDREETLPSMKKLKAELRNGTYVSYAEPSETLLGTMARDALGANASQAQKEASSEAYLTQWRQSHYHGPDPLAYQKLLHNEQRALAANSSPAAMGLAVTGTLRLLAIAVEFNGTDSTAGFVHPKSPDLGDGRTCITETLTTATSTGPLHNQIPAPGPRDNFSGWYPSYERSYYEKLVFSTEGITDRLRLDLTDPEDGKPGIDVSGQTMRNYYESISSKRVRFDGGPKGVTAWITLPHSEAYYGADACTLDPDTGEYDAGDIADMEGLPTNPYYGFGPEGLVADVITSINASDPNFPWKDYDTDGDGVIDHLVFFHAGKDKSAGGGAQGYQAIWAHRSSVSNTDPNFIAAGGGTPNDPSDDVRIGGYTMQYEDVETGVLVHEFGHDLGLPDLYDTSRAGESSTDAWDLMSLGSNTGKLIGTNPTNMSAWCKFALGWTDPKVVTPEGTAQDILLGQTSNPPIGTTQSVRVDLPPTETTIAELPEGSANAWWTGNDQSGASNTLTRNLDLTTQTAPISISFDINWDIEEDWDYLFLEVSVDGGQTFTQTQGFDVDTGDELTTPPDYSDPNGGIGRNDRSFGYTGTSGGFIRAYHDLSPFAGQNVVLRFIYRTDEAVLGQGAFIDNIAITSATGPILNDPVESTDGWTPAVDTRFSGYPLGEGWKLSNGVVVSPKYYLLEWRNAEGFDKGLLYTYHTIFSEITADGRDEFYVDHIKSNVPGMLVWLRDTRYGQEPFGADNSILDDRLYADGPSEGPKGGLLIVDSHPDPLRGPRGGTLTTDLGSYPYPPLNNWRGRAQSPNAAFSLKDTPAISLSLASGSIDPATTVVTTTAYAPLPGVPGFHDALGYYPGVEELPQVITTLSTTTTQRLKKYALTDPDASVVVPAKGYYPPRTPAGFTGKGVETKPSSASVSTFETLYTLQDPTTGYPIEASVGSFGTLSVGDAGGVEVTGQHSGNPGSDDLQYGYHFKVINQAASGATGTVRIWNAMEAGEVSGKVSVTTSGNFANPVTVTASALNAGSPITMTLYSDFNEAQATFVEGSATDGALPVRATLAEVQQALRSGGITAVAALQVTPGEATALVYTTPAPVDSGAKLNFRYQLARKAGFPAVQVVNRLIGPSFTEEAELTAGSIVRLPIIAK